MFCSQCGNPVEDSAKYCLNCGNELPQASAQGVARPVGQISPDTSEAFFRAVVGPRNQDAYLRRFARFEAQGKSGISWHWPAFFVTFYWLLYRKMWLNALIYFILPYLVMIPVGLGSVLLGDAVGETVASLGYFVYFFGMLVLPPLYANAIYYRHCKKKIAEVCSSPNDAPRQLGELSAKGGTSNALLIVFLLLLCVALIGILAAIAIPAYQGYTTRARMVEAISIGNDAAKSVAGHYGADQQSPDSFAGGLSRSESAFAQKRCG